MDENFVNDYSIEASKVVAMYSLSGVHKTQRLGQYFLNYCLPGVQWPELYYEEDFAKAGRMIEDYLRRNEHSLRLCLE